MCQNINATSSATLYLAENKSKPRFNKSILKTNASAIITSLHSRTINPDFSK